MSSRFPSHLLVLIVASFLLVAGSSCSANSLEDATVGKVVQSSNSQRIVAKEVREVVCNCGDAGADIRKKVEQSYANDNAIHWEFRGEAGFGASLKPLGVGVDFAPALETVYGKEWSTSRSHSVAFDLPATPGSQMEYRIQWIETWQPGTIEIRTEKGVETLQYYYLRGVEANLVEKGGRNLGCSASCQESSSVVLVSTPSPGASASTTASESQIFTDRPAIVIENNLIQPVRIDIDGDDRGVIAEYSSKTYLLDRYPVRVRWETVKQTTTEGTPIGDDMSASWSSVNPGAKLTIDNMIGDDRYFFYVVLANETDRDCKVSINDGWEYENRPYAIIASNEEDVGFGYYRLFTNSNVTLYCDANDPGEYWFWGLRPDSEKGTSFFRTVRKGDGVKTFTYK